MKNMKRLFLSNVALLLLFTACSTPRATHDWKSSLQSQPGKGLVVFYAPHVGSMAPKFCIYAKNALLTTEFRQDSFFTYHADPGPLEVYTKVNAGSTPAELLAQITIGQTRMKAPTVNVESNQVYFLEFGPAAFGPARFKKLVPKEEGESKINQCEWINP
jgi:hypothetical protein